MFEFERIIKAVMPYKDKVIVCLETAADFLSLSNGGLYESKIQVYSDEDLDIQGFEVVRRDDCFNNVEYIEKNGVYCTSIEQTLVDMLENEHSIDIQTLLESLSKYYFENGENFSQLEARLTDKQRRVFNTWEYDAINYYTEDY